MAPSRPAAQCQPPIIQSALYMDVCSDVLFLLLNCTRSAILSVRHAHTHKQTDAPSRNDRPTNERMNQSTDQYHHHNQGQTATVLASPAPPHRAERGCRYRTTNRPSLGLSPSRTMAPPTLTNFIYPPHQHHPGPLCLPSRAPVSPGGCLTQHRHDFTARSTLAYSGDTHRHIQRSIDRTAHTRSIRNIPNPIPVSPIQQQQQQQTSRWQATGDCQRAISIYRGFGVLYSGVAAASRNCSNGSNGGGGGGGRRVQVRAVRCSAA